MMPKASIVIPCYNLGQYLDEAVDSVLAQTFQDFEIIIVNDGSTDPDTNRLLANYKKPKCTVLRTENQGLSSARNNGIRMASGEYVCCLDSDDRYHPEFLEKCVKVLDDDKNRRYGFVTTHAQLFGQSENIWKCSGYQPYHLVIENTIHVASLFRRQCWHEVRGYATNLTAYEDWNYWLSIVSRGYEWALIPEPLFFYRDRPGSMMKRADDKKLALKGIINANNVKFIRDNILDILAECDKYNAESQKIWQRLNEVNNLVVETDKRLAQKSEEAHQWWLSLQDANQKRAEAEAKVHEFRLSSENAWNRLNEVSISLAEMIDAKDWFEREKNKWEQECQRLNLELKTVYDSRIYRLKLLIRDSLKDKKKLPLLPLKLVWLLLPGSFRANIKRLFDRKKYFQKTIKIKNKKWSAGPLVSVVIPCYNYGEYIEEAIDSVLSQTFTNFEIIVVDGGSNETTIDFLRKLNKPKTKIYFRNGRHLVGSNRNYGIEKSKGKYICCLDADDTINHTYLEKALFLLEKYNYDVVHPSVQCFGGSDILWHANDASFLDNLRNCNAVSTVAVFNKQAWLQSGGYKDWSVGNGHVPEDWEFWTRLLGLGFRFKKIKEPLMNYRVHQKGLTAQCDLSLEDQKAIIEKENITFLTEKNIEFIRNKNRLNYFVQDPYLNLKEYREEGIGNILFALPFPIMGGADTILLSIAEILYKANYKIFCVTTVEYDPLFGDNTKRYERVCKGVYHLPDFLDNEREHEDFVTYLIEAKNIDAIFLAGSELVYHLLPDLKRRVPQLKVIDLLFNDVGHINNNRKYNRYIDLNIVENKNVKGVLMEKYREDASRIRLIPNGVDVRGRFSPDSINQEELTETRKQFNIADEKFVISFFGRFSEEKSPEFFIDIAEKLKDDPRYFFIAAGQGPLFYGIKERVSGANLTRVVLMPGIVDTTTFLALTDLVILPSKIDGRPNIVMESLSMGVPVIASRIGGVPELIADETNGYLCDVGDLEAFVSKIKQLTSDEALYRRFRKNARKYALENFDLEKMNNSYLNIFRELLGQQKNHQS